MLLLAIIVMVFSIDSTAITPIKGAKTMNRDCGAWHYDCENHRSCRTCVFEAGAGYGAEVECVWAMGPACP